MIFPFVYVIAVSFSSYKDVVGGGLILFPKHPDAGGVHGRSSTAASSTHALTVSVVLTLVGTLTNMFMTVTMAYGLSRPGVPASGFVLALVLFTLLFSAGIIPNYLLVKQLGLINSYASLILPGAISAFNLVIMRQFFMSLPPELLESARIDGANDLWILLRIILPLSKAGAGGRRALLRRRALERLLRRDAVLERRGPSGRSSWCSGSTCCRAAWRPR